jgi:hypothetical protein
LTGFLEGVELLHRFAKTQGTKMKSKQIENVGHCRLEIQPKEHFLECTMKEHWGMKEGRAWKFYIPKGIDMLDLKRIVDFRMKHDFNVVVKAFSVCYLLSKTV